jgi:hypothetical protein
MGGFGGYMLIDGVFIAFGYSGHINIINVINNITQYSTEIGKGASEININQLD